jgi:folate-dependent phosphoribosylglycinamide formyltransferase PurN
MKLIFAGTPEFAASALQALLAAGHEIALVLTQPDRPAGRGMNLQASAVKQVALAHGIPLHQPERLKDPVTHQPIRDACALGAELMVVAAYGLILPQAVLDLPPRGCLNIHASLLPRWRGAAPIHRAIEAGDTQTGITIMRMEAGLDTGPKLLTSVIDIEAQDTTGSLHDRLAALGGRAIVDALARLDALPAVPQPRTRRYLRQQGRQGRCPAGLERAGPNAGAQAARLQPVSGCLGTLGRRTGQALARRSHYRPGRARPGAGRRCERDCGGLWRGRAVPDRTAKTGRSPSRQRRLPARYAA